jgi:hypothetical protein
MASWNASVSGMREGGSTDGGGAGRGALADFGALGGFGALAGLGGFGSFSLGGFGGAAAAVTYSVLRERDGGRAV